jgi:hypothetical protein
MSWRNKSFFTFGFLAAAAAAQPPASDPEYSKLRDAQLSESFVVENVVIHRDVSTITLKRGTVSFVAPVLGRVTAGVFIGEGEFGLAPMLSYERDHLKSVTGDESVKDTFDRAVFFFTDSAYEELKGSGKSGPVSAGANDRWKDIRQKLRQPGEDNIEAETLTDLYNPQQAGFFDAFIHGRKYDDLRFYLIPRGADDTPEEVALINHDPGKNEDGTWYLAHRSTEYAGGRLTSVEDKRSIGAENYKIETQIGGNDHLTAKAELQVRAKVAGERVLKLTLLPALRVSAVRNGGRSVTFIQEDRKRDGGLYVILPEPTVKDQDYQLTFEYSGDKVLEKAGGGNFAVGARTSWYPNVNAFKDQAKYELIFKVPRQYTLVSVGKPVEQTREGNLTVTKWVSDVPLAVAGFNYGAFTKKETTIPQLSYTLEGYANSDLPDYIKSASGQIGGMSPVRLLDQTMSQTNVAMQIYDRFFGHPTYGRIAITQQAEFNFGQSWPGLVYLPISAFIDSTQRFQLLGGMSKRLNDFIQEVTPHEVAHQWWGHMVGWTSYRDEWLSEGFADFSAGLFLQFSDPKPDKYLKYLETARDAVVTKNNFGISPNDAGPLCMGFRLNTLRTGPAYQRLVYPKGGYVLHMLRSMLWNSQTGDANFMAMMHDYVATHLYKNASTESFQAVVEKHMSKTMDLTGDGKMDWFFQEWVYGTDIPKYKFDYELMAGSGGKTRLKASLTQSGVSDTFRMQVPIYTDVDGRVIRIGTVAIGGNTTVPLDVELPQKPKRVLINANFDVLSQK